MVNKSKQLLRSIGIICALYLIFFCSWLFFSQQSFLNSNRYMSYISIHIIYIIVLIILSYIYDAFSIGKRKIIEVIFSFMISCVISACVFYVLDTLAFRYFFRIWYLLVAIVCQSVFIAFVCKKANDHYYNNLIPKNTLIVYDNIHDISKIKSIPYFDVKYSIVKKTKSNSIRINMDFSKYDAVFVIGSESITRNTIISNCVLNNIDVFVIPQIGDIVISGGKYVQESYVPILNVSTNDSSSFFIIIKRILDVFLSLLAIIMLSPFMLITAVVIKAYDGGPAIYSHIRLTQNGKKFRIYKFRSMKVDAEKDGVARLVSKNDDRITPIGKIIRAIRFDELPQLFNILKGDMSFVGPRPERPEIVEQYVKKYPTFNMRLLVKAGLTGYAQIYGKYNTEPIDKLKMDLFYINNMSLLFDLKMIFLTLRTILIKDSTESVEEGKTTADL